MSRVNCSSSPSPWWRTSSTSSDHRTRQVSQLSTRQDSSKHARRYDFQPDNYHQRPVPSHRLGFPTYIIGQRSSFESASPKDFQLKQQQSFSSKNQKSVEAVSFSKTYKPLRDRTTGPASPPKQFQTVLKNDQSKLYFSGMKRPDLTDFVDCPPAKLQKRNMEDRQDVSYQSRSLQLSRSNVLWCAPPCRQRTRSRERKYDLVPHGSRSEKSYPDRDSALDKRRANMNLKTPCPDDDGHAMLNSKVSRGQHHTSWKQFPSDKLSSDLEFSLPWSEVQQSPRLHRKSGVGMTHHQEQRHSSESWKHIWHSKCADQLPRLHYKLSKRNEISLTQNGRYQKNNCHHQRQKSSAINNRYLRDDHRQRGTSFSSECDSCHKMKTIKPQANHVCYERKSRDNVRQESRNSTRSSQSPSNESFINCSWREKSSSSSLSSAKSRRPHSVDKVTSSPSGGSVDKGSVDSQFSRSDIDLKAKIPKFNVDNVVVIHHTNEGARPLCMREEFSGKSYPLINNDKHISVVEQNFNLADRSAPSLMDPCDKKQMADCTSSELSRVAEESFKSTQVMRKVQEKAETVSATFHKPCRTMTNTSSLVTKKDVADERFVRTRPDSFGEPIGQEQTDHFSKSAGAEASLTSKKSTYDLRQKISERRQLRTGRNTSSKIVSSWPNRWKNLSRTSFRNLVYGSIVTERKYSFTPRKMGFRHSLLK